MWWSLSKKGLVVDAIVRDARRAENSGSDRARRARRSARRGQAAGDRRRSARARRPADGVSRIEERGLCPAGGRGAQGSPIDRAADRYAAQWARAWARVASPAVAQFEAGRSRRRTPGLAVPPGVLPENSQQAGLTGQPVGVNLRSICLLIGWVPESSSHRRVRNTEPLKYRTNCDCRVEASRRGF